MFNHIITLLVTSLTISVIVILIAQNLSLLKKVKIKTTELTNKHVNIKKRREENKKLLVNLHVGVAMFSPKGELLISNKKGN